MVALPRAWTTGSSFFLFRTSGLRSPPQMSRTSFRTCRASPSCLPQRDIASTAVSPAPATRAPRPIAQA